MRRLVNAIAKYLPRRRRRFWWYVSPRRRGAGVGVLALLVLLGFAYWRLTNDQHIRDQARRYLRDLTGGRIELARARFSLFGSAELSDVRVFLPGDPSSAPLVAVRTLILRHRPWSLLAGKLRVTEVNCLGAAVTLEYDIQRDAFNFDRLLEARRQRKVPALDRLPPIRIRDARLQWVDVDGKLRLPHEPTVVSLTLEPHGRGAYLVSLEEQRAGGREAMNLQALLDVGAGRLTRLSGSASLGGLDRALPGKYRQWRQRYDVAGEIHWRGGAQSAGAEGLELELVDVSLHLPEPEGGLTLERVRGVMYLDEQGLSLSGVSGQARQLNGARFELSGRYGGFDSQSPFDLALKAWGLEIPRPQTLEGPLGEWLADLSRDFAPTGKLDLDVRLKRDAGGGSSTTGTVQLHDLRACLRWFPYPLERVNGGLRLEKGRVVLENVTAWHGPARMTASGHIAGYDDYDVLVESQDVEADQALYEAMPSKAQSAWRQLAPQGALGSRVRVRRGPADPGRDIDVELRLDGRASVCYVGFPYRLGQLLGTVRIHGSQIAIQGIRGGSGPASCGIQGRLDASGDGIAADLDIEARRLAVDEDLIRAVEQASGRRDWIIQPVGTVEQATAKVRRAAGGPLDLDVRAAVSGLSGGMALAPYVFEQGTGELTVQPGRLIFRDFRAQRGPTSVALNGQVFLTEPIGLDLNLQARRLIFDAPLRDILPASLQAVWDEFSPGGPADVDFSLRRRAPDAAATDYRLEVRPLDMQASWRDWPLAMEHLGGTVVLTPGRVELADLHSNDGASTLSLSGRVELGAGLTSGRISGRAAGLPISAELLASAPREVSSLAQRFSAGGSVDLELTGLEFHRPSAKATSQPAGPSTTWRGNGSVRLHEAAVDLDFGRRTLSGQINGSASQDDRGLSLDLAVDLDRIDVGGREITRLAGRCTKSPDSPTIRMDDFSATVGAGRAAGWAQIDLADPMEYGLRISAEKVPLARLLTTGTQPDRAVQGLLEGSLELTGRVGQVESRRAGGVLRVSEARMYELPVVLGLFHVIPVPLPAKTYLSEAQIEYRLEGQRLTLDRIYVSGPANSMLGSGTMDMRHETVDLIFLTGPAGKLPRLARLALPLGSLSGDIMQIRLWGPWTHPRVQPVALRSLDEAVRDLLNPSGTD